MQITLMRHGPPAVDGRTPVSPRTFGDWIQRYNEGGIEVDAKPPLTAVEAASAAKFVICSDLPRSIDTAKRLGTSVDLYDALFREVDMPYLGANFPKLSPRSWAVIFRLAWIGGFAPEVERLSDARKRADACVQRLRELAEEHESLLLVGHGSLLWLIARRLSRSGWQGPQKAPRQHWASGTWHAPYFS